MSAGAPTPAAANRAVKARVAALLLPGLGQVVLRRWAVAGALLLLTAANLTFVGLCLLELGRATAAAVEAGGVVDWHAYLVPVGKIVAETLILLGLYIWGFVDVTLALRREAAAGR